MTVAIFSYFCYKVGMVNAYHSHIPASPNDPCFICLDPLTETDVVAHEGEGHKHPVHKECIREVFESYCPVCKVDINKDSLYNFRERFYRNLRSSTTFALLGGAIEILNTHENSSPQTNLLQELTYFAGAATLWLSAKVMPQPRIASTASFAGGTAMPIFAYRIINNLNVIAANVAENLTGLRIIRPLAAASVSYVAAISYTTLKYLFNR